MLLLMLLINMISSRDIIDPFRAFEVARDWPNGQPSIARRCRHIRRMHRHSAKQVTSHDSALLIHCGVETQSDRT
jgi:hypothetical protein